MEIEFEHKAPYFERFVNVSVEKFLRTEMQRLSQKLPSSQQPRRSNQKGPSEGALLFRDFSNGILTVAENLIKSFNFNGCSYSIAKYIYEFFHLEEKMRPLMRLNEPYEVKQALLKMFTYAYAWSCWRIGRENTDSAQQKQFRAKLERRIERIINGLKIHEDIILIEVSDLKANKFENDLLLPLVDKLIKEYCSHQFINFMINVSANCDLVETLKKTKELQKDIRKYLMRNDQVQRREEPRREEPVLNKINVKQEIGMKFEHEDIKTEEKPVGSKQVFGEDESTPVKKRGINMKETTPKIFKNKSRRSYKKRGIVDHRKELFFEKFIKGAAISKYNSIKKEEESSTAHITPINHKRTKRMLNEKLKLRNSERNNNKHQSSKDMMRALERSKSKTGRKIRTSYGNQLVYIKRKKRKKSSIVKKTYHNSSDKKSNVLINLKNAQKQLINDLSDCEFIEEEEETIEVYKSPNIKNPEEIIVKKVSSDLKYGTSSLPKLIQSELMQSIQKKNSTSKMELQGSSAEKSQSKNSKNKVEVIDCESENEDFLTFEDWSQNIVAFSTPLKDNIVDNNLIDVSQKQLNFEKIGI